jgi:hypothetical protein
MNDKFDGLARIAVPKLRWSSVQPSKIGPKFSAKKCRVCIKLVCAQDGRHAIHEYSYCTKTKKQSCFKTTLKLSGEGRNLKQWGHEPPLVRPDFQGSSIA